MTKTIILSILTASILVAQTIELEPITVTSATKTKQSIKDVTSNVNVITSEEIEEKHYTTVSEALNSISGVNFTSNGGLGSTTSVFVRGVDSQRVLVLIDGIRYNDVTSTNGAPFAHLMIGDIQQIEVVKGAQSGVWGADASAGVINIITKSAKDGLHGSVNAEYGSFNTKKYGALSSYKTDNYYLQLSSQKITTDGFSSASPKGDDIDDYEKDGYSNSTSNIKLGFNINETNKIDIAHTIIDAHSDYDYKTTPDAELYSTIMNQFSKINFNHIDSFNELDIYVKRSIFDREYHSSSVSEYNGEVYEYGLKSNIPYNEKDFIVISADYKTFEHKNNIDEKYSNKGLSLTNSNYFKDILDGDLVLTESIRGDIYDKFDNKNTGKFGFKYLSKSVESLIFSSNIGTAYNVPTLYNLYGADTTYGTTTYVVGNEDLTPENTISVDISIEYKKLQITYFKNYIEDMIEYDSINGYYNEDGTSIIQGVEISYKNSITETLMVTANYTFLDPKNKDGEVLARRAKETTNLGFDYYPADDLQLGLYGQYIGERYDSANEQDEQTGEYAVFNFVANYNINKNFTTYAKVDNILNRYYQVVDGYATAPISGYIGIRANF